MLALGVVRPAAAEPPAPAAPIPAPPAEAIVAPAAPAPAAAPEVSRRRRLIAPIAAGALSVAVLGVGAGLLIDAGARYPALDRQCQYGCLASDVATLDQHQRAGQALLVIGAAGLVLDAVQIALSLRRPRAPAPPIVVAPTLGGLAASGSF